MPANHHDEALMLDFGVCERAELGPSMKRELEGRCPASETNTLLAYGTWEHGNMSSRHLVTLHRAHAPHMLLYLPRLSIYSVDSAIIALWDAWEVSAIGGEGARQL